MTKSEAGRLGGIKTRDKYGREHFSRIGRLGALEFWRRYTIFPVGINNFMIVSRETGDYINFLYPEGRDLRNGKRSIVNPGW